MGTERGVAVGEIRLCRGIEVAEGRRQAIAAVLLGCSAEALSASWRPSAKATKRSPPRARNPEKDSRK
jgi:hypothetical protein